jgi:HptB-dependent secretion and biofilm anti anti-sigma factor
VSNLIVFLDSEQKPHSFATHVFLELSVLTNTVVSIKLPTRFVFGYHKEFNDQKNSIFLNSNIKQLELDFSQVIYMDSAALGMLVILAKKAKTHSVTVTIKKPSCTIEDMLYLASMDELYKLSA